MWRWIVFAVVVVCLSAAATVAVQLMPEPSPEPLGIVPAGDAPQGPLPLATIEGDLTYKFGVMAQEDTGTHEWVVRNDGEGDLILTPGQSTCSCTIASLKGGEKAVVKPGSTTNVKLKWETRRNNGEYEKASTILTNDPEHPEVRFSVAGIVRPAILRFPAEEVIDLGSLPNDQETKRPIAILSPDKPDMKITKVTSRRTDLISTELKPLPPEDIKAFEREYNAKAGHRLEMTIKPGNNLGTFSAEIVVETDHPSKPELIIPLTGRIVGPISASPEALRISSVSGPIGGGAPVTLTVRGQEQTSFTVVDKPKKLEVTISPVPDRKGAGGEAAKARQYVMNVRIPPGTTPGQILGPIVLKTDHPKAQQVKVPVDIIVHGGS